MSKLRYILLLLFVAILSSSQAQSWQDSLIVYFRQGSSSYELSYKGNEARMVEFIKHIKDVQNKTGHSIVGVRFHSNTSPEGTLQINERLGKQRAENVVKRLLKDVTFPDSIVLVDPKSSKWDDLHTYMHDHKDIKYWDELHNIIIDNTLTDTQKEVQVRRLRGGVVWYYLLNKVFPDMRNAVVHVVVDVEPLPTPDAMGRHEIEEKHDSADVVLPEPLPVVKTEVVEEVDTVPAPVVEYGPNDKIILKTNTIGWLMMIANVGVEYQHSSGFAFSLPIYYSAMNYFTRTIKMRTFAIQPEVRYYIPGLEGFFAGAHFGLAWYNVAFDGLWRYQDHGRNTPAIGGGLNIGYKMPLGKSKRWGLEFSLGGGVYKLHYDKFINESNGKYAYDEKRTFIGIDNAAVSFTYTFDLKPRKK